jgi:hypothetical protein
LLPATSGGRQLHLDFELKTAKPGKLLVPGKCIHRCGIPGVAEYLQSSYLLKNFSLELGTCHQEKISFFLPQIIGLGV